MANYTRLGGSDASFNQMIQRFGVVTVMNAKVFDVAELGFDFASKDAYGIYNELKDVETKGVKGYRCTLDTLKIANVSIEGPSKTITGGQYSNPLIKFGKSARLEMQDALGNAEAVEALCGGVVEYKNSAAGDIIGLHNGEDFAGPKCIIGDSFFIDQRTGAQVKVAIIFYQFLPDSLFNLTQDAEGDATVFDMNGDLLTTEILVGQKGEAENPKPHGVFYSIIDPNNGAASTGYVKFTKGVNGTITVEALDGATVKVDNSDTLTIAKGTAARVVATKNGKVVYDSVVSA